MEENKTTIEVEAAEPKDKRQVVKSVVRLVVSLGVTRVIDDVIDATAPAEMTIWAKALRKIGAISLGWFVGDWVEKSVDATYAQIDATVKQLQEIAEKAKEGETGAEAEASEAV